MVVYPGDIKAERGLMQIPTSAGQGVIAPACTFENVGMLDLGVDVLRVCMEQSTRFTEAGELLAFPNRGGPGFGWVPLHPRRYSYDDRYEYATMDGCPENPGKYASVMLCCHRSLSLQPIFTRPEKGRDLPGALFGCHPNPSLERQTLPGEIWALGKISQFREESQTPPFLVS